MLAATSPTTPPSAPTSGFSARSSTVTARPRWRQTEATSDPVKPAPTTTRLGPASSRSRIARESSLVLIPRTPASAA